MNPFPKCISKDCKIKDKCLRSKESSVLSEANYDKIYLDEDKCSWFIDYSILPQENTEND